MPVREQLIEILRKPIFPHELAGPTEAVADYLLDNGVTIQRWIPVTERLPEHEEVVLVVGKRGGIYTAWCNRRHRNPGWHKLNSKSHYCEPTHWMPLPQAPGKEG